MPFRVLDDRAAQQTVEKFSGNGLKADEPAVTLADLADPARSARVSFRGSEPIHPASVVKRFYLVAAHCWLEDGRLTDTPELRCALSDRVVGSYNEATHHVVDVLTGWTRQTRHDAAYVELAAGRKFVLVNFHQRPRERARHHPRGRADGHRRAAPVALTAHGPCRCASDPRRPAR